MRVSETLRLSVTPADARELGEGLRALRGRTGLRRLAARQHQAPGSLVLSKSALHRYEQGEMPPLEYASHLDALYQGEGWVEMSMRSLWRPRWNPWSQEHGDARRMHAGRWPAQYGGPVWIKLLPQPESLGQRHEIELEWGSWLRHVSIPLDEGGVVLVTGKAIDHDRISRACNLTSDPPVYALYGAGENLKEDVVIDIRRGWVIANPQADTNEFRYGPDRGQ